MNELMRKIIIRIAFILMGAGGLLIIISSIIAAISGYPFDNADIGLMFAAVRLFLIGALTIGISLFIHVITGAILGWPEWERRPEIIEWYCGERDVVSEGEAVCPTQP
jgi:hypothetical protein